MELLSDECISLHINYLLKFYMFFTSNSKYPPSLGTIIQLILGMYIVPIRGEV